MIFHQLYIVWFGVEGLWGLKISLVAVGEVESHQYRVLRSLGICRPFNIALICLLSTVLKILINPNSLVAWILKAKYFPTWSRFIIARDGNNPFLWQSIWHYLYFVTRLITKMLPLFHWNVALHLIFSENIVLFPYS